MLDLTLKNRNIEIESLKNELESMRLCFQCEECEFSSGTESDLKIHIEQIHQHIYVLIVIVPLWDKRN